MEPPSSDQTHLRAAQGYVELGLWEEAEAELDGLTDKAKLAVEVMEIRLAAYLGRNKWADAEALAVLLLARDPDRPAYQTALEIAQRMIRREPLDESLLRGLPPSPEQGPKLRRRRRS